MERKTQPCRPYRRTDLACEAEPGGTGAAPVRRFSAGGIPAEETRIPPDTGEAGGCPAGRYVTLHCEKIWLLDRREMAKTAAAAAEILRTFLKDALGKHPDRDTAVLVAGLGNRFITADSIGPRTADRVTVTNHAAEEQTLAALLGCCRVGTVSPGTEGQTGLPACRVIAGAAAALGADVIIAIDALAARSTDRLASTVQFTDAGIRPGSGIGNHRDALTREAMGIPVIAIGVPTAVDSSTLVWDALEEAGIREVSPALEKVLENGRRHIVSPRESDLIAESASKLLAGALNRTLTPMLL